MKVNWSRPKRKPRKRLFALLFLLSLSIVSVVYLRLKDSSSNQPAGSSSPEPTMENRIIEHPRICVLADLSGPFSQQGEVFRLGAEMAWKEVRAQGSKGELIIQDAGEDPSEAVRIAGDLAQDPDVLLVVAHLPMATLEELIPVYEKEKILLVVPSGSHQNLVGHPWLLSMVCSDRREGKFAAGAVQKLAKGKDAAVIYDSDSYGKLLFEGFKEEAEKIRLSAPAIGYGRDDASADAVIAQVLQLNPSVIWLAGSPLWGSDVVEALTEKGYKGRFLAPRSYAGLLLDDLFSKYLDRLFILRPVSIAAARNEGLKNFCETFREECWREPEGLAVLAYDTIKLAGDALVKGPFHRDKIRDTFLRHNSPQTAYEGIGGRVYFDGNNQAQRSLHVTVYRSGKFTPAPDL